MPENGLPTIEEMSAQQAEQDAYAADDAQNAQADVIQQEESSMPVPEVAATSNSNQYDYWNQGARPPRTARPRNSGQPTFAPDGRRAFYQSDYYPTPNNGTWTSPDGTFKLATYGQAPAAILGQRIQDVRLRKQQLAQVAQQFDPYAGIEAVKPQYAKDFNANTKELWDDFLATKIKEHGSRREAMKAIVTPGSEDNWQWRDINRSQNDKGRYINHEVERAAQNLKDMEAGQVRYDEKTHQLGMEVLNALGTYQKGSVGNSKKFEQATRDYERRAEWVSHFKPLDDRVKKFAIERLGPEGVQFDKHGRMMVTSWDDLKYVTDYLDDVADREWETGMWLKDYGSKEEFAKDLKDYYPISVKHNVRTNTIPYPPGGGAGQQPKVLAGDIQEKVWRIKDDQGRQVTGTYAKPLMQVVDGRPVQFKDKVLLQGTDPNDRREMVPTKIGMNDRGEMVVLAVDPADVTTTKTIDKDPNYQKLIKDLDYESKVYDSARYAYEQALKGLDTKGDKASFNDEEFSALRKAAEESLAKRDSVIEKKSKLESEFQSTTTKEKEETAYPLKGNEAILNGVLGGALQPIIDEVKKEHAALLGRANEAIFKNSPQGAAPAASLAQRKQQLSDDIEEERLYGKRLSDGAPLDKAKLKAEAESIAKEEAKLISAPKTYAIGDRRTDSKGQEFEKVEGGWKRIK